MSFIIQSNSFKYKSSQTERQILSAMIILKLTLLKKKKTICEKWMFYNFLVYGSFMQISGLAGRTKVFFTPKIGLVGRMVGNFVFWKFLN